MTSYDQIFTIFMLNCKVDGYDLPTTETGMHNMIVNGVIMYNNRMRDNIVTDNTTETVDRALNDDQILLLANFIKLAYLKNELLIFTTTWQPFQKDIGLKNFSYQLKGLEAIAERHEQYIEKLILNQQEDFM